MGGLTCTVEIDLSECSNDSEKNEDNSSSVKLKPIIVSNTSISVNPMKKETINCAFDIAQKILLTNAKDNSHFEFSYKMKTECPDGTVLFHDEDARQLQVVGGDIVDFNQK